MFTSDVKNIGWGRVLEAPDMKSKGDRLIFKLKQEPRLFMGLFPEHQF